LLVVCVRATLLQGFGGTDFDISMFNRPVQQMLDKISAVRRVPLCPVD
jgi:hypothetical protein